MAEKGKSDSACSGGNFAVHYHPAHKEGRAGGTGTDIRGSSGRKHRRAGKGRTVVGESLCGGDGGAVTENSGEHGGGGQGAGHDYREVLRGADCGKGAAG